MKTVKIMRFWLLFVPPMNIIGNCIQNFLLAGLSSNEWRNNNWNKHETTGYRKPSHTEQYLQSNWGPQPDTTTKLFIIEEKGRGREVQQGISGKSSEWWESHRKSKRHIAEWTETIRNIRVGPLHIAALSEHLTRVSTYHKPVNTLRSLRVHQNERELHI